MKGKGGTEAHFPSGAMAFIEDQVEHSGEKRRRRMNSIANRVVLSPYRDTSDERLKHPPLCGRPRLKY